MQAINSLEILKKGLPDAGLPPRHIVVVGAGIAGLVSALLLQESGHKVTVNRCVSFQFVHSPQPLH